MTTLRERIDQTVLNMIEGKEYKKYLNIYHHKITMPTQKPSVHISFRFYNDRREYYIFTVMVQLRETFPLASIILSRLAPERYFFKVIKTVKKEIPHHETLPFILMDQHLMTYCKNEKHLPPGLLIDQYDKIKEEMLDYIDTIT